MRDVLFSCQIRGYKHNRLVAACMMENKWRSQESTQLLCCICFLCISRLHYYSCTNTASHRSITTPWSNSMSSKSTSSVIVMSLDSNSALESLVNGSTALINVVEPQWECERDEGPSSALWLIIILITAGRWSRGRRQPTTSLRKRKEINEMQVGGIISN